MRQIIKRKDRFEKEAVFKVWRKRVFFMKILSLLYQGFALEDLNTDEYF